MGMPGFRDGKTPSNAQYCTQQNREYPTPYLKQFTECEGVLFERIMLVCVFRVCLCLEYIRLFRVFLYLRFVARRMCRICVILCMFACVSCAWLMYVSILCVLRPYACVLCAWFLYACMWCALCISPLMGDFSWRRRLRPCSHGRTYAVIITSHAYRRENCAPTHVYKLRGYTYTHTQNIKVNTQPLM